MFTCLLTISPGCAYVPQVNGSDSQGPDGTVRADYDRRYAAGRQDPRGHIPRVLPEG